MQPRTAPNTVLASAAFLAILTSAPAADAAALADALSAYRNNRVAEAEAIFKEVAADAMASARDRAGALRELGRIDGLVRGETDAMQAAMAATPSGEERCTTAVLALRIYRDFGDAAAPVAYAEGASACAPGEADILNVQLARTYLALASAQPEHRSSLLAQTAAALDRVDALLGRSPSIASARLSLAIMQRNSDAAFAAWRDYYWLTDSDAPQALTVYAGQVQTTFVAGLARSASESETVALIDLLIRAGFVDDAGRFARETNIAARAGEAPLWRRSLAFLTIDETVRAATLRANREMAAGGRARWYEDEISATRNRLMREAALTGDPASAIGQTFGLYGSLGETSGYPSLHAGHLVRDERIAVAQYGRTDTLKFIVIDNMISNGFESWLWDGWAEAGGWANDEAIVQVRSAYTTGPLRALRRVRPGAVRDRFLAEIERDAPAERAALGRDGVAQLTATANRLELQAADQIAARATSDAAFVEEYWRAVIEYSITLHEGRHVLDGQERRKLSVRDLEYRAKLSQIALSGDPRLGLANVVGQTIEETPHGRANRSILEGYRTWIRRHRDEIATFDRNAPSLSQLHLLTDEQIRAVARSLDPWAQ